MTFNGLEALGKKLSSIKDMQGAKQVVKVNTAELQSKMTRNAVFTRGYSTGQTRRSIDMTIEGDGMTGKVKPNTEYSPYVEYGTRKMTAQPFVKPAYNEQKEQFKQDMRRLVE